MWSGPYPSLWDISLTTSTRTSPLRMYSNLIRGWCKLHHQAHQQHIISSISWVALVIITRHNTDKSRMTNLWNVGHFNLHNCLFATFHLKKVGLDGNLCDIKAFPFAACDFWFMLIVFWWLMEWFFPNQQHRDDELLLTFTVCWFKDYLKQ